jgi:hypothetical protein
LAYLKNSIGLQDSYYVREHLETELTFRELVEVPDYPDHENILRQNSPLICMKKELNF